MINYSLSWSFFSFVFRTAVYIIRCHGVEKLLRELDPGGEGRGENLRETGELAAAALQQEAGQAGA